MNTEHRNKNTSENECFSIDYIPIPNHLRDSAHKALTPATLISRFAISCPTSPGFCSPATPPAAPASSFAPASLTFVLLPLCFVMQKVFTPRTLPLPICAPPCPDFASLCHASSTSLALDCPTSLTTLALDCPTSRFLLCFALPPLPRTSSSASRFPSASHFPSASRFPSASPRSASPRWQSRARRRT
ncbi:hypothetical protein B0H13DRAFT_2346427 [Mycena leptocephala]|nr:hypothetical protein B0H13DRAFT_2346427 [Mycena leptocephala]